MSQLSGGGHERHLYSNETSHDHEDQEESSDSDQSHTQEQHKGRKRRATALSLSKRKSNRLRVTHSKKASKGAVQGGGAGGGGGDAIMQHSPSSSRDGGSVSGISGGSVHDFFFMGEGKEPGAHGHHRSVPEQHSDHGHDRHVLNSTVHERQRFRERDGTDSIHDRGNGDRHVHSWRGPVLEPSVTPSNVPHDPRSLSAAQHYAQCMNHSDSGLDEDDDVVARHAANGGREEEDDLGGDGNEAEEEDKDKDDEENDFVFLRLLPGESSWGLGAEFAQEIQGGGGLVGSEDDDDDEDDDGEEADMVVDKDFCPVCQLRMTPGDGPTIDQLFLYLLDYGKSEIKSFAKFISRYYATHIQYRLINDEKMQKPWHWTCVLRHCRDHSNSGTVFAKDQIAVTNSLLAVTSSNMVRVKKRTLKGVIEQCSRPSQVNERLMREASIDPGTVRQFKELITMRRQLMDQYEKSYEREKSFIQSAAQQHKAELANSRKANRNKRAKITHTDEVANFLSTSFS
jgi:hypothetical protein